MILNFITIKNDNNKWSTLFINYGGKNIFFVERSNFREGGSTLEVRTLHLCTPMNLIKNDFSITLKKIINVIIFCFFKALQILIILFYSKWSHKIYYKLII